MPTASVPRGYELQATRTFSGVGYCKPILSLVLKMY